MLPKLALLVMLPLACSVLLSSSALAKSAETTDNQSKKLSPDKVIRDKPGPAKTSLAKPNSVKIDSLKLEQTSSIWGNCTVFATTSAIRINVPERSFYIIAKAPLWRVQIYNERKKKRFIAPQKWSGFSATRLGLNLGNIKDYTAEKTSFRYLPATSYHLKDQLRMGEILEFHQYEKAHPKIYMTDICFTAIDDKHAVSSAALILNHFFDMPRGCLGVPVLLTGKNNEKDKIFRLKTNTLARASVSPDLFAEANYATVSKAEELTTAPTAEATADMLKDFGDYKD